MSTLKLQTSGGINNRDQSKTTRPPVVKEAVNVDWADTGEIRQRNGFTKVYSATKCHSIFRHGDLLYYVDNGSLVQRDLQSGLLKLLKSGIGNNPLCYATAAGRVFFSNGIISGAIVGGQYQSLGVTPPPMQPKLTTSAVGGLFAGTYFVAITWLRKGEESGTGKAVQIDVKAGGGIVLSDFPAPPSDVDKVAVYVTPCNGKHLYLYGEYSSSISSVTVGHAINSIELATQFGKPAPAFNAMAAYKGRLYGANGNYIYYSEPVNYGLFKTNSYYPFNSEVKLIASVQDALFVVTADKTYRISDINQDGVPSIIEVLPFGGFGNATMDSQNMASYWMSEFGLVIARTDGVAAIAADRIKIDRFNKGALMVIEQDGCRRAVGTYLR